jgi:hypothetical protein
VSVVFSAVLSLAVGFRWLAFVIAVLLGSFPFYLLGCFIRGLFTKPRVHLAQPESLSLRVTDWRRR